MDIATVLAFGCPAISAVAGWFHLRLQRIEKEMISKESVEDKIDGIKTRLSRIEECLDRLNDKMDNLVLKKL